MGGSNNIFVSKIFLFILICTGLFHFSFFFAEADAFRICLNFPREYRKTRHLDWKHTVFKRQTDSYSTKRIYIEITFTLHIYVTIPIFIDLYRSIFRFIFNYHYSQSSSKYRIYMLSKCFHYKAFSTNSNTFNIVVSIRLVWLLLTKRGMQLHNIIFWLHSFAVLLAFAGLSK